MKFFEKLKDKLILVVIVVILGNFLLANPVSAKSFLATAGGKLLEPICDLLIFARRCYYKCITDKFPYRSKGSNTS